MENGPNLVTPLSVHQPSLKNGQVNPVMATCPTTNPDSIHGTELNGGSDVDKKSDSDSDSSAFDALIIDESVKTPKLNKPNGKRLKRRPTVRAYKKPRTFKTGLTKTTYNPQETDLSSQFLSGSPSENRSWDRTAGTTTRKSEETNRKSEEATGDTERTLEETEEISEETDRTTGKSIKEPLDIKATSKLITGDFAETPFDLNKTRKSPRGELTERAAQVHLAEEITTSLLEPPHLEQVGTPSTEQVGTPFSDQSPLSEQIFQQIKCEESLEEDKIKKPDDLSRKQTPHSRRCRISSNRLKAKKKKSQLSTREYAQYLGLQPTVQFKCVKCKCAGFETLASLNEHSVQCTATESIQEQSPTNPTTTQFKIHRKVFLCSVCGTYYENWNLFLHMREVHRRFICLYCLGMFSQPEKLCLHLISKHNCLPGNFDTAQDFLLKYKDPCYLLCCECEKVFNEQEDFFNHECSQPAGSAIEATLEPSNNKICTPNNQSKSGKLEKVDKIGRDTNKRDNSCMGGTNGKDPKSDDTKCAEDMYCRLNTYNKEDMCSKDSKCNIEDTFRKENTCSKGETCNKEDNKIDRGSNDNIYSTRNTFDQGDLNTVNKSTIKNNKITKSSKVDENVDENVNKNTDRTLNKTTDRTLNRKTDKTLNKSTDETLNKSTDKTFNTSTLKNVNKNTVDDTMKNKTLEHLTGETDVDLNLNDCDFGNSNREKQLVDTARIEGDMHHLGNQVTDDNILSNNLSSEESKLVTGPKRSLEGSYPESESEDNVRDFDRNSASEDSFTRINKRKTGKDSRLTDYPSEKYRSDESKSKDCRSKEYSFKEYSPKGCSSREYSPKGYSPKGYSSKEYDSKDFGSKDDDSRDYGSKNDSRDYAFKDESREYESKDDNLSKNGNNPSESLEERGTSNFDGISKYFDRQNENSSGSHYNKSFEEDLGSPRYHQLSKFHPESNFQTHSERSLSEISHPSVSHRALSRSPFSTRSQVSPRSQISLRSQVSPRSQDSPKPDLPSHLEEVRKVPKVTLKLSNFTPYNSDHENDRQDSDGSEGLVMELDNIESETEALNTNQLTEDEKMEEDMVVEEEHQEAEQLTMVNNSYAVAGPETPVIELELEQPLDKFEIRTLIQRCLRATVSICIYCNHARKIAVNGKQLGLHAIAEHRFSAVVNSITAEELIPESFNSRIKDGLLELENIYFNLELNSPEEAITFSHVFECFQCRYSTTVHKELYLHNRKMHAKTILLCIMCKSNFYSYSELICHLCPGLYALENEVQFRCCMCVSDYLPSAFRLMVHLRKKHHACDVCLELCNNQSRLSNHVWKHKLHHFCYRCGIAYRNKPDITKHLFWKHGTESVLCKRCLQKKWPHVYHFCIPPSSFTCEECSLSFSRAVALMVHKRLHSSEMPHACTFQDCTEKFVSKKLLVKHEFKHREPTEEELMEAAAKPDEKNREDEDVEVEVDKVETEEAKVEAEVEKPAPKVDIYDLPELNLSESDSSDSELETMGVAQKTSDNSKEALGGSILDSGVSGGGILEGGALGGGILEGGLLGGDGQNSTLVLEEGNKELGASGGIVAEKPQILDNIWDDFKNYQASKEKTDILSEVVPEQDEIVSAGPAKPTVEELAEIISKDHDYCVRFPDEMKEVIQGEKMEIDTNLDHDYCSSGQSPTKPPEQLKEEGVKIKKSDASSDSSSDSDSSSCTCGSNCSCSSSSGSSSSSSDSSGSDSSTSEGRRKKVLRKTQRKQAKEKAKAQERLSKGNSKNLMKGSLAKGNLAQGHPNKGNLGRGNLMGDLGTGNLGPRNLATGNQATGQNLTKEYLASNEYLPSEEYLAKEDRTKEYLSQQNKEKESLEKAPTQLEISIQESDLDTTETDTDEDFYDEHPQKLAKQLLAEKRNKLLMQVPGNEPINGSFMETSRPSTPSLPEEMKPKKKSKSKKRKKKKNSKYASEEHHVSNIPMKIKHSDPMVAPFSIFSRQSPVATGQASPMYSVIEENLQIPSASFGSPGQNHKAYSAAEADANLRASKRRRVPNKFYGYSSDEEREKALPSVGKWRKMDYTPVVPSPMVVPPLTIKTTSKMMPKLMSKGTSKGRTMPVSNRLEARTIPRVEPRALPRTIPKMTPKGVSRGIPKTLSSMGGQGNQVVEPISIRTSSNPGEFKVHMQSSLRTLQMKSSGNEQETGSDSNESSSEDEVSPVVPRKEQTQLYCYCRCPYDEVSEMIGCDSSDCNIEWFHFECVGIMVPPKGQWFCPDCRKKKLQRRDVLQAQ